jgi:hypothetical protein
MERKNTIRLRLSGIELEALKTYAESRSLTMSEVLRDYVKTLIPKDNEQQG